MAAVSVILITYKGLRTAGNLPPQDDAATPETEGNNSED